jgi:hypothetical protein
MSAIGMTARKKCRSRRVDRGSISTRSSCSRRSLNTIAEPATSSMATVPSRKGAPMIDPMAMSMASGSPRWRASATTGMVDSGSAVPTAARIAPTAPAPRLSR